MAEKIECPKCKHGFSVQEALSADLEAKYQKKFATDVKLKEAELEELVKAKLSAATNSLEAKLKLELGNKSRLEMEDLRNQVLEKAKIAEESQKTELELRKKQREFEVKEKTFDLELQRRLDEEKVKIQEDTARTLVGEQRLKAAEKDKQLDDLRKQIEDLKRKAEQGSQQSQGEILEIEIESALKSMFPGDQIEPVAKGKAGGDIIHRVITAQGHLAGTILWETKRTKSWSDSWIAKLKEDQRAISAELGVIISQALPRDVSNLTVMDNIWVSDYGTFRGIALALRAKLIQVHQAKASAVNKGEKMDFLFSYLTGTQFKQRIEAILESYQTLRLDLDKERKVIQKMWASREQQIERALSSSITMYGEIHGIVGASLPRIESLEFESLQAPTKIE